MCQATQNTALKARYHHALPRLARPQPLHLQGCHFHGYPQARCPPWAQQSQQCMAAHPAAFPPCLHPMQLRAGTSYPPWPCQKTAWLRSQSQPWSMQLNHPKTQPLQPKLQQRALTHLCPQGCWGHISISGKGKPGRKHYFQGSIATQRCRLTVPN